MSDAANKRDYKGWISLLIGACAVWISYETFVWQKSQTEKDDADSATPGQQSTGGSSDNASSPDTYNHGSTTHSEPAPTEEKPQPPTDPKHDKGNGNGNKKNNKKH